MGLSNAVQFDRKSSTVDGSREIHIGDFNDEHLKTFTVDIGYASAEDLRS